MAILVIQLARFGDIFQTWPTLKALSRAHPDEEIHLLVRERFVGATEGLDAIGVRVHVLPTRGILEKIAVGSGDEMRDEASAINALYDFLAPLHALRFSRVINLSFSPFSSYLTDELSSHAGAAVSGYTRHADGYLKIPDDSSAYFYAQVGVGRWNRYHLCDVFASVAGVDLQAEDYWHPARVTNKGNSVLVHLGASQATKTYPPEMWSDVLRGLIHAVDGSIILIGSAAERSLSEAVCARVKSGRILNRVGQSSMGDLCRWVGEAALVIGADSAPMQIATLTGTRALNLSCAAVRFWETGPLTPGSRILFAAEIHRISIGQILAEAASMLNGGQALASTIVREKNEFRVPAELLAIEPDHFCWKLIQALYTAADYPELSRGESALAFHRLFDLAELALSQLDHWAHAGPTSSIRTILQSVDEMLTQLPAMDDFVAPVVRWFETERLRMGPGDADAMLKRTRALFEQLLWVAAVYHRRAEGNRMLERAADLVKLCAPQLREYNLASVQDSFQELMTIAQAAATLAPTKVDAANPWPEVLNRLEGALARRDFIEAADILESDWTEVLNSAPGQLSWECGREGDPNRTTADAK